MDVKLTKELGLRYLISLGIATLLAVVIGGFMQLTLFSGEEPISWFVWIIIIPLIAIIGMVLD
jgi:hypothetical protein